MTLIDPQPTFDQARNLASKVESNWRNVILPQSLRTAFSQAWEAKVGYPANQATAFMKFFTSAKKSENVTDVDLALAISVSPLRSLLYGFKIAAENIATTHNISAYGEIYKSKVQGEPSCWPQFTAAIEATDSIAPSEKTLLKEFLTDSKKYYDIKGIARDDFATPALCRASGKRIDRFSIVDQLAAATTTEIYTQFVQFINGIEVLTPQTDTILKFNTDRQYHLRNSTLTKPFTILTGASGTGKTRLASSLANYLSKEDGSNIAIVAVGADWTDSRSVLGFVNHLREFNGKPIYQSTPILDLILRSKEDPDYPYFLILDEMNLSHVERYFSDFLSAMEQSNGSLELHKEGANKLPRFAGDEAGVPHFIEYPKNLFVIGTVNIDETTYMFSPKVLDRANVIEFIVDEDEMKGFLGDPQSYPEIARAELGVSEGFLQLAQQAQAGKLETLPATCAKDIGDHLVNLLKILKEGRFEFAYRTAKEVNTYLRVCRHLSEDSGAWDGGKWEKDLDDQILQKLLPKLHGSMGRIGPLLAHLATYCHKGEIQAIEKGQTGIKLKEAETLERTEQTPFPRSLAKLKSMIHTLLDEQFVSFIQ